MDEFADLEDELRFNKISADTESIKSLVKSIEYDGLDQLYSSQNGVQNRMFPRELLLWSLA